MWHFLSGALLPFAIFTNGAFSRSRLLAIQIKHLVASQS